MPPQEITFKYWQVLLWVNVSEPFLLQVGSDQILVGVAPGSVNTLHELSNPVAAMNRDESLSFKEVWNFARNRQGSKQ